MMQIGDIHENVSEFSGKAIMGEGKQLHQSILLWQYVYNLCVSVSERFEGFIL